MNIKSFNTFINENHTEERKANISSSMKKSWKERTKYIEQNCKNCGNEYTVKDIVRGRRVKYCSDKCKWEGIAKINKVKNKEITLQQIKDGTHQGWKSRNITSFPEKFFKKVLDYNNITYIREKPILKKSLGMDNPYNYFLDFYIEKNNKKIDLEIDSKIHTYPERKKSDEIRDYYLKKNGYIVYRIPWKNIRYKPGKEFIENEIKKFIEFYNNL